VSPAPTSATTAPALPLREDDCYRAVESRDARFDGWFVGAVHTTGIYCRPSCPAVTPRRANMSFFPTAAAAQIRGFRACKRCRPDASPGSPEWNVRADVVARAMRLIADGVVDRDGVPGLARRLGYSTRHLNRLLTDELGAGPLAIARAQRAQTARVLVETTSMSMTEIAHAAGFSSVRQFNDTVREVYAMAPTALRSPTRRPPSDGGWLTLRLPYRPPLAAPDLFGFLGERAVPGVESWDGVTYRRSLRLPGGPGIVALSPGEGAVSCRLRLASLSDVHAAVQRCRRLLDLDADPATVDRHLGTDPTLGPLVSARPGLRSPGSVDGTELLVRAILGQQVSVRAARTAAGRCVAAVGDRLPDDMLATVGPRMGAVGVAGADDVDGVAVAEACAGVTHLFPDVGTLVARGPDQWRMPLARARALHGALAALADGRIVLDPGADRAETVRALESLPGIGPWTSSYVVMRALGDPDAFMPTDLGVHHALAALGLPASAREATALAERWRPWRSYALHHLWAALAVPTTPKDLR
jgi:AraC family transcriptional regulator of adaptative response / DNA-3-methyladenine glycosylase II